MPSVMEMWAMKLSGVAPCQCHSSEGVKTMSPGGSVILPPGLHSPASSVDVEGLAQDVGVPGGAGAGRTAPG